MQYPLLNAFLTMTWFFLWILWIFLVVRIIFDIFASQDLSGWGKAGWTIVVIVLPFVGIICYLIARGGRMHERGYASSGASDEIIRSYQRPPV